MPNLWLGGLDKIHLKINNSDHMITWWFMGKCLDSKSDSKQAKSCLSKEKWLSAENGKALLQNPKNLCSNSHLESC